MELMGLIVLGFSKPTPGPNLLTMAFGQPFAK
jgi:hypothetical protein